MASAPEKKQIEMLKHILKTDREHYFLHETYTGRELQRILKEREDLIKKLKRSNTLLATKNRKGREYNSAARGYMNKLYTDTYYSSISALPPGNEKQKQTNIYELNKNQKGHNFVETRGYSKVIHVDGSAMNVNTSLEAARAIGRKNYDAVRQFAAFALEKKRRATSGRLPSFHKKNGTAYTPEEFEQKRRTLLAAKKKREEEKKKKEKEEEEKRMQEAEAQRQRNLNVQREEARQVHRLEMEKRRRRAEQSQTVLSLNPDLRQKANAAKRKREEREAEIAKIEAESKRQAQTEKERKQQSRTVYTMDAAALQKLQKQNRLARR